MKDKNFHKTAGIIFLIVGVLHLLRAVMSWPMKVDNFMIAVWFSYLAGVILLLMGIWAFKLKKKKNDD